MVSYERTLLFILVDTDINGMMPYYDHVLELDDKTVAGVEAIEEYDPAGDFHIVDIVNNLSLISPRHENARWFHLYLASKGARVFSSFFDEESPIYAGELPGLDKIRKVSVEGSISADRAAFFNEFGINYIGRTKLDPKNIVILDNKKDNPTHSPEKDETLDVLYKSLPADWWGSCGFVSTNNVDKLGHFFDTIPDIVPVAFTTGAFSKMKYLGLDYATIGVPKNTRDYGIEVREAANRVGHR